MIPSAPAARHLLAIARGIQPGAGCRCAVCGDSPFDAGRATPKMLGPNFTSYELCASATAQDVCEGCVSLLAGKPGDNPPPMRCMHAVATADGIAYPATRELREVLVTPPTVPHVVVWAASRKRHASLHAGISTAEEQLVGSDACTIAVRREHMPALAAVEHMRGYITIAAVLAGGHDPIAAQRAGVARWSSWTDTIAPHVGHPLLELLAAISARIEPDDREESDMLDPADEAAAELLAIIAQSSQQRRQDGLRFWRSTLGRRLAARSRLPLAGCVSRLLEDLGCCPTESHAAVGWLEALDEGQTSAVEVALRERGPLIVAVAFHYLKESRNA